MEEDLSKYEFNRFIPDEEEEEDQNDSEEEDWVLTEALDEEQSPDKENSNETSEEEVKNNVEFGNRGGEKEREATADKPITKDKSVWKKMSPQFHKTLSDIFSQRHGSRAAKKAKKNNQGKKVGKEHSTPLKIMQDNQHHQATDAATSSVSDMENSEGQQQQEQQLGLPATASPTQLLNKIHEKDPSVSPKMSQTQKLDQILERHRKEMQDITMRYEKERNDLLQYHARELYEAGKEKV